MPVLQMCLRSLYRGSSLWELHGCRNSDTINRAVFGLLPKVRTGEQSKTMKHKYHGISYELIANEFWVEAETYEEAKEKLDSYDAEFGDAEQADSFIQLYSIEVIED